ncbi:MAG: carbamoyl phosphate synthase, partial [Candidatus Eremiobacteraeota bacterium]|nr:carbamoyl phosphate synthase [Candidatus Eremiobacteraeota bacterium]
TWVGPHADAIDAIGDKISSRPAMVAAGVPVVPGATTPLASADDALAAAREYGLPIALKASGGGGGKGLKIARTLEDVPGAFATAQREAEAYFKNPTIYVERYLDNPKHVELQILADKHGNVVHVGERDCSLQRRHQKLYEETPALVSERVRERLREAGIKAARAIEYDSVGTIETLVSGDDFFFLEMNTRIQVEHTISEMTSGLDLVAEQLRVAAGEPLGYAQSDIHFRGHAIEVRVNAEDPAQGFRPAPGTITAYAEPGGIGVRVDAAATLGTTISPDYDSMIAKLIVWAPNRDAARARLRRAIDEYRIGGVPTTLGFLRALNDTPEVASAAYGTATLEAFASTWTPAPSAPQTEAASAAAAAAPADADVVRVEVND